MQDRRCTSREPWREAETKAGMRDEAGKDDEDDNGEGADAEEHGDTIELMLATHWDTSPVMQDRRCTSREPCREAETEAGMRDEAGKDDEDDNGEGRMLKSTATPLNSCWPCTETDHQSCRTGDTHHASHGARQRCRQACAPRRREMTKTILERVRRLNSRGHH